MKVKMKVSIRKDFEFLLAYFSKIPMVNLVIESDKNFDYGFGMLGTNGGMVTHKQENTHYVLESQFISQNHQPFYIYRNKDYYESCKITFIVQGIVCEDLPIWISILLLYGKVKVSIWNMYKFHEIQQFVLNKFVWNNQNIYYQVYTTLKGLESIDTEFVVKVRSDEIFTDLTEFINNIYDHPSKLHCTNIFLRKKSNYPFHISDYIIGGKTIDIHHMFEGAKHVLENHIPRNKKYFDKCVWCPEQILTVAYFLFVKNIDENDFLKYSLANEIHMTPIQMFGWFKFTFSTQTIGYSSRNLKTKGISKICITNENFQSYKSMFIEVESIEDLES